MRKVIRFSLFMVALTFVATACGLLQEPEEASSTIEAIPLAVETSTPVPEVEEPAPTSEPQEAYPPPEDAENEDEAEAYPQPEDTGGESGPSANLQIYQITPGESSVRFELDEDLRGERKTVIGITDQVAGEIAVDLSDLSTAQIGVMQINARTLATDNNFRNRAIQNEILDTGDFEFIIFTPAAINDLPASTSIGEEVTFTVSGDLAIRDITQPATFTVVATAVSEDQLVGTASTTVLRSDFGLQIPSVPNVANVEQEVDLYIDFIANRT